MRSGVKSRFQPIGNTFLNLGTDEVVPLRRSSSFSGFVPYDLQEPVALLAPPLRPHDGKMVDRAAVQHSLRPHPDAGTALAGRVESSVRRDVDIKSSDRPASVTTLVICNMPRDVTQIDLARALDADGFANRYDFLYMPAEFGDSRHKGFAFVNFASAATAKCAMKAWQHKRVFGGGGGLTLSAARIQGKAANIARWSTARRRRIRNPGFRPLVSDLDGSDVEGAPQRPRTLKSVSTPFAAVARG